MFNPFTHPRSSPCWRVVLAGLAGIAVCSAAATQGAAAHGRTAINWAPAPYRAGASVLRRSAPQSPTLYSFQGQPDGANPWSDLVYLDGTFYGTTSGGGTDNLGTVFSYSGGTEHVLHSFTASPDGANPYAGLIAVGGWLFGTTYYGGTYGHGTVFAVTPTGRYQVVYSFGTSGPDDGFQPLSRLLYYDGALYGTTRGGGTGNAAGTVFKLTRAGNGVSESVIYSFQGNGQNGDGASPQAGLIQYGGALYGTTTYGGGANDCGTVFRATPSGVETVLHSFSGAPNDGCKPEAEVLAYNGALYGTTNNGGTSNGEGTVFKLAPSGYSVIYNFNYTATHEDGIGPEAALVNVNGTFYSTTTQSGPDGSGTVFSITPSGTENLVSVFSGSGNSPVQPEAGVIDVNGLLYGTSLYGGGPGQGYGTIYAVPL